MSQDGKRQSFFKGHAQRDEGPGHTRLVHPDATGCDTEDLEEYREGRDRDSGGERNLYPESLRRDHKHDRLEQPAWDGPQRGPGQLKTRHLFQMSLDYLHCSPARHPSQSRDGQSGAQDEEGSQGGHKERAGKREALQPLASAARNCHKDPCARRDRDKHRKVQETCNGGSRGGFGTRYAAPHRHQRPRCLPYAKRQHMVGQQRGLQDGKQGEGPGPVRQQHPPRDGPQPERGRKCRDKRSQQFRMGTESSDCRPKLRPVDHKADQNNDADREQEPQADFDGQPHLPSPCPCAYFMFSVLVWRYQRTVCRSLNLM